MAAVLGRMLLHLAIAARGVVKLSATQCAAAADSHLLAQQQVQAGGRLVQVFASVRLYSAATHPVISRAMPGRKWLQKLKRS
jgi:hypothetical protein